MINNIIAYYPALEPNIKNVSSLPNGLGANYLLCMLGYNGDLIAHSWHRKIPKIPSGYLLLTFEKTK